MLGERLFEMLQRIRTRLPETEIHLLTNGRAFADKEYARRLAACGTDHILLGIPLHSDYAGDHDAITQVKGSFDETLLGLYNLARYGFGIELRVVITRMNYRRLPNLPNFVYRNLPFVEFVSLMGLEYTGYTVKNKIRYGLTLWIISKNWNKPFKVFGIGVSMSLFLTFRDAFFRRHYGHLPANPFRTGRHPIYRFVSIVSRRPTAAVCLRLPKPKAAEFVPLRNKPDNHAVVIVSHRGWNPPCRNYRPYIPPDPPVQGFG